MRLTNVAHLRLPFGRLVGYDLQVGDPGAPLPVSFDQRRHVGAGDRAGSWVALSFRLTGQRELSDLAEAWRAVVQRHGTLRTVFVPDASTGTDDAGPGLHEVEIGEGRWVEHPIPAGQPVNEALRDWVATVDHTAYLFGTAAGPHPFPSMVRDFVRGTGDEARAQCLEQYGVLPDAIAACVGGGSNAIGLFTAFLEDDEVDIYGFEAGGDGVDTPRHAATIHAGDSGVLHGARTYVLQDDDGQTVESHSISAGLDYPGVGPQHAQLAHSGRATYLPVTDTEAMEAFSLLARTEGIIPAIESSHAIAGGLKVAERLAAEKGPEATVLINLSGRGDKDMGTAIEYFGLGEAGQEDER